MKVETWKNNPEIFWKPYYVLSIIDQMNGTKYFSDEFKYVQELSFLSLLWLWSFL